MATVTKIPCGTRGVERLKSRVHPARTLKDITERTPASLCMKTQKGLPVAKGSLHQCLRSTARGDSTHTLEGAMQCCQQLGPRRVKAVPPPPSVAFVASGAVGETEL